MITTGRPPESSARETEVVDVESGETCTKLKKFPAKNYGAVGASLNGTPIVCGGRYSSTYYQTCYKFTISGWQEFASMEENRVFAAGVMFQNKFHVFGGYDNDVFGGGYDNVTLPQK